MSEPRTKASAPPTWRIPVAVDDVPEVGQHFALAPADDERAAIAQLVGLRELARLQADFDVHRQGENGLRVVGRVSASVGQNCVVTLEPLTNEIEEEVDLVFMPQPAVQQTWSAKDDTDEEAADVKWQDPEPLIDGIVDLGMLATEFLILGIDPYPRKSGAVFEPPPDAAPEQSPFAALARLSKGPDDT